MAISREVVDEFVEDLSEVVRAQYLVTSLYANTLEKALKMMFEEVDKELEGWEKSRITLDGFSYEESGGNYKVDMLVHTYLTGGGFVEVKLRILADLWIRLVEDSGVVEFDIEPYEVELVSADIEE